MKKIIWIIAISIPIISIFMLPTIVKADTITNWNTQQGRIQTTHDGTDSWTSWENINGDNSLVITPTYPVKAIAWRVRASKGLSRENTYTFRFNYKPTPDAINPSSFYFQNDSTGELEQNVVCSTERYDSGYYWYKCDFTPDTSYTSSQYLYIKINFKLSYISEMRMGIRGYEERKSTNAVITEQTIDLINNSNQNTQEIINNINEANENLLNGLSEQNQVCNIIDKTYILSNNKVLGNDGSLISTDVNIGVTDYIPITQNNNLYKIIQNTEFSNRLCFSDSLKQNISCIQASSVGLGKITIPNGTEYVRFTIINDSRNAPQYRVCQNGNQAIQDTLNQDHDYNNKMTDQTQIDNMEQKENEILEYLNLDPPDDLIDITINPTIATFIWDIINRIRLSSTYITLLFTSILSLGVIKLVLNR